MKNINGQLLTLEEACIQHKRLIEKYAKKYAWRGKEVGLELDDLISVGTVGFIEAYHKLDEERSNKFTTYATSVVIGHIKSAVYRKSGGNLMISDRIQQRAKEFMATNPTEISPRAIMKTLNMYHVYAYDVFYYIVFRDSVSMEKEIGTIKEDGEIVRVIDTFKSHADYTRFDVEDIRAVLTEGENAVCDLLLEGYTQKEIRSILGISRSAVGARVLRMRAKYNDMLEGVL